MSISFPFKWLQAKLTGGKLVWLRDHDGEVNLAIAYEDAFGGLRAERWWPFRIDAALLLPGGSVCRPCYVKEWKYRD